MSSTAKPGECSRNAVAPTEVARAATSMRKLDRTAALATSAASTTSGVRLLAASVIPVMALVSPGPWCSDRTPGRPLIRAQASAITAAPPSCRAARYRAPRAIRALVTLKLPLPTTPNTVSAPRLVSTAATASVTGSPSFAGIRTAGVRSARPGLSPGTGCRTRR